MPGHYTEVCYNPQSTAAIQAIGRDPKGRWQYRYHSSHTKKTASHKFSHMLHFAKQLPLLRREEIQRRSLQGGGQPLSKADNVGAAIHLLDQCHFRVGNPMYLAQNDSRGLSNLQGRHVKLSGKKANIEFKGKTGQMNRCEVTDPAMVAFLRAKKGKAHEELFRYTNKRGETSVLRPNDVNQVLRRYNVNAKDFRTWKANCYLVQELLRGKRVLEEKERMERLKRVVEHVAEKMCHTPQVCRSHYLHPGVMDLYLQQDVEKYRKMWKGERRGKYAVEKVLVQILKKIHSAR